MMPLNVGVAMVLADGASAGKSREAFVRLGTWGAVLLGLVLVLALLVHYYRSRFRAEDRDSGQSFTLQDLREMRTRGDLSESEFQRLRATVLAEFPGSQDDSASQRRANSGESG